MTVEIRILFLTALLFVPILAESQYECGAHGRFEYCIDGIPGCVVGCHCHPGYYFDTDSKICEPSIKLTQDFRRQYLAEPTRLYVAPITTTAEDQPITPNAVDEKIDEIAKDADDLGDWLYNQFFKTIENQVINKTQGEELPPTRRSGNILLQKPSRRSHWKSKRKKKRKTKGLKSKLLRITEDDSLFDSDSGESSHEEYSTSSSESETETEEKSEKKKKKDDHGHKKIIIFNKKPQPPLPSFIFMPNMDTPYYPPIGLPPPPAMPMYPMVPVPPVMPGPNIGGPLFPYPGIPYKCEDDDATRTESTSTAATTILTTEKATSTATTEATTGSPSITMETPTTVSEPTSESTTVPPTTETTAEPATSGPPPNLRQRHKKRKKPNGRINDEIGVPTNPLFSGNRNKQLMKRLREKLNRKRKLENFFADQYQEFEAPLIGNNPSEFIPKRDFMTPDEMHPPQDVDFKYLAELIHKANLNKTSKNRSKSKINIPESEPVVLHPSRRNYYPINNMNNNLKNNVKRQRSRMEDPNDLFYTNLGKQIASMIRKIDSKEQREVNIEIEGSKQQSQTSPIFNENNFASRSFWERSVRSPLKYTNTFTKEMDYLKKSNEDLFSLENKVEIAATTTPKLSLLDLENIISTVQKVKLTKPKRNNHYQETNDNSNASLKLNLLPDNIETIQPVPKSKPVQSFINKDSDTINELNARKQQATSNSFLLSHFRQLSPDYAGSIRNTGTRKDLFQNMKPTRKPSTKTTPDASTPTLPLYRINNGMPTFFEHLKSKTNLKYQLSPVLMNHRKLNYHTNNKNPYLFENASPIQFSRINKSLTPHGMLEKPSYFHHEFHHFDYFDM